MVIGIVEIEHALSLPRKNKQICNILQMYSFQ